MAGVIQARMGPVRDNLRGRRQRLRTIYQVTQSGVATLLYTFGSQAFAQIPMVQGTDGKLLRSNSPGWDRTTMA